MATSARDPKNITLHYSGFIILSLTPGLPLVRADNLIEAARQLKLEELASALETYALGSGRLLQGRLAEPLGNVAGRALRARGPRPVPTPTPVESRALPGGNLANFWLIDARDRGNAAEIVHQLNSLKGVDLAYRELVTSFPNAGHPSDAQHYRQGYLEDAPTGVDACYAWTQSGTHGVGVKVVDVESGWYLEHADFAATWAGLQPLYGFNWQMQNLQNHGAAVLGILAAQHNRRGIAGLAPEAQVLLSSHYAEAKVQGKVVRTEGHVAAALRAAANQTGPGDVILLEVQRNRHPEGLPAEVLKADWRAIRDAVDKGVTVVEAAGNGSFDLDTFRHSDLPGWPPEKDSGAIMVGASQGPAAHRRSPDSNFGRRVDCFAWGHDVWTTTGQENVYDNFSGTSAAAAIVAGTALVVQSWRKASGAPPFEPEELRDKFRTLGTPSPDDIGRMPDLKRILASGS